MKTVTWTQPNGLDVVVVEHRVAPVVAIEVWVRVGAADETADELGLAHIHEHMIFKGSERLGPGEIAREVEACGGEINARTSFDYTVYHLEMASRFASTGLAILAEAVQRPAFDPEELERELEVIVEEIKRAQDSPGHVASQLLFSTAFRGHAYGRPITGMAEQIVHFDAAAVRRFFDRWYVPANMSLVIVGDVDADQIRGEIGDVFDQPSTPVPDRPSRVVADEPGDRVAVFWRSETREIHLNLAFEIPGLEHEDVPALDVLSVVLGGTASSRLDVRLRQERSLVNAIGTFAYTPHDRGLFTVSATFQAADELRCEEVVEAVLDELFGYAESAIPAEAVARARDLIVSQTVYEKQSMRGLAQKFGFYRALVGDLAAEAAYFAAIAAVEPADVRRVAARYLVATGLTATAVVPENLATLEVESLADWVARARERAEAERAEVSFECAEDGVRRGVCPPLPILVEPRPDTGLVSVWLTTFGGKRHEPQGLSGGSELMASMLTRGTRSRSAVAVSEAFERIGGGMEAFSGHNTISVSATFLAEHLRTGLELIAECVLEPAFDADEFGRERALQLEDLESQIEDPSSRAFRKLYEALFGAHPYARPTLGDLVSLAEIEVDEIRELHFETLLRPGRAFAIVGDVDVDEVFRLVPRHFDWTDDPTRAVSAPAPPAPGDGPHLQVTRLDRQQAHIAVGFPGARLDSARRYELEVIAAVLTGQGGRLFRQLRDRESLAYSVSAFNRPDLDGGWFGAYIATSVNKVDRALEGLGKELRRLASDGIDADELQRAHRYLCGAHDISLQRSSTRSSLLALNELYGLGHAHHRVYPSKIQAVSADVVRAAAQSLLPELAYVSVVVPEATPVSLQPFLDSRR